MHEVASGRNRTCPPSAKKRTLRAQINQSRSDWADRLIMRSNGERRGARYSRRVIMYSALCQGHWQCGPDHPQSFIDRKEDRAILSELGLTQVVISRSAAENGLA